MSSLTLIITVGIAIVLVLIGLSFLFPDEKKKKRRKKRIESAPEPAPTPSAAKGNWEEIAGKRARYIETLKNEMLQLGHMYKSKERELVFERDKTAKLQEKVKLEQEWRQKEEDSVNKNTRKFQELQAELVKSEKNFEQEHTLNLKMDKELKEARRELEFLTQDKRSMTLELRGLQTSLEQIKKELAEQKQLNAELTKKKDDISWVAKSDHDRLEQLLKEKEMELQRVLRERNQP